jgi:hypothetical protein
VYKKGPPVVSEMLKDVSSVLESSVSNSKEIEIEAIDLSSIVYGCTWRETSEPNSRDSFVHTPNETF